MIIDFNQAQCQRFDTVVTKIINAPKKYLNFNSVTDFYQSAWLNELPNGTVWSASGLDDGSSDDFYIAIQFKQQFLHLDIQNMKIHISFKNRFGDLLLDTVML